MQKSIRIQFDDYDKLKELSKQAGVPLSKYVGMLLDPSEDKTKQAIQDARRALSVLEVLATRPELNK
jgi:hypothetical protein